MVRLTTPEDRIADGLYAVAAALRDVALAISGDGVSTEPTPPRDPVFEEVDDVEEVDLPDEVSVEIGDSVRILRDGESLDVDSLIGVFEAYDSAAPEDANCTVIDPTTGAWQLAGLAELARVAV